MIFPMDGHGLLCRTSAPVFLCRWWALPPRDHRGRALALPLSLSRNIPQHRPYRLIHIASVRLATSSAWSMRADSTGFLYLYDPPGSLSNLSDANRGGDPIYQAEALFFERMRSDPLLRNRDIASARLYYVPTWSVRLLTNLAYRSNVFHLDRIIRELRHSSVEFNLTWSLNQSAHVFFFGGDKGACLLPRGPTYLTHWGLRTSWDHMLVPDQYRLPESHDTNIHHRACTLPTDVVVPPGIRFAPPADLGEDRSQPATWNCTLFFAGTLKRRVSSICKNASGVQEPCYSQGVRIRVFAEHARRDGFCLHEHLPNDVHSKLMRSSRFCLAVNGEGFGIRLSQAMSAGCVPLIIQPRVAQPLDDVLPYHRFSISIDHLADIPSLHQRLSRVSSTEHAELRRQVLRYAPAFSWAAEHGGMAYEWTRFSLCRRAGLPCEHLRPTSPRPG